MIRLWISTYWKEDWYNNKELTSYVDDFIKKAIKGYQNDMDFDENEQKKGIQLVESIKTLITKKRNETKFEDLNKTFRPRSVSTESNRKKLKKSIPHRRKVSFMLGPRLSFNVKDQNIISSINNYIQLSDIPNDLLRIPNNKISDQITLHIFKKYLLITPRECLNQQSKKNKKNELTQNIKAYKDTFNNIVKWVQSSILLQTQVSKRAKYIKKWIKIADQLCLLLIDGFCALTV